jgi:hypothetical protein
MPAGRTLTIRTTSPPRDLMIPLRDALAKKDWIRAADIAMALGRKSRSALPDSLQSDFDAIIVAFGQYEAGRDDAARAGLNGIGLNSPFADWKLLLRGLMAYASGDNARAVDNWNRLHAERLPARIAAPLRAAHDRAFRVALPAAKQKRLREAADQLRGRSLSSLRAIQGKLGQPERFAAALADVAAILPRLDAEMPQLRPILARCFYAAAIHGDPDAVQRLRLLFDPPADDPTWDRRHALAAEHRGDWGNANRYWRRYEAVLERRCEFSDADRRRARALVWCRCGDNAMRAAAGPRGSKSKGDAEKCYRRGLEIDPGVCDAYRGLFELYRIHERLDAAIAVGERLAELEPHNSEVVCELAKMAERHGDWNAAINWFARAGALRPFDRELVAASNRALRSRAQVSAQAGDAAQAEADLRAVNEATPSIALLSQRAALAFQIGDVVHGEERASAARAIDEPAAALALVAEMSRLKIRRPVRAPFEAALRQAWTGPSKITSAIALAEIAHDQSRHQAEFRGFKGHLAKVRRYVERALDSPITVADGVRLCGLLESLRWTKLLRRAAHSAAVQFPREAAFPYFEARGLMLERGDCGSWRVGELLYRAHKLVDAALPHDPAARDLRAQIEAAERHHAGPPLGLLDVIEMFDD